MKKTVKTVKSNRISVWLWRNIQISYENFVEYLNISLIFESKIGLLSLKKYMSNLQNKLWKKLTFWALKAVKNVKEAIVFNNSSLQEEFIRK